MERARQFQEAVRRGRPGFAGLALVLALAANSAGFAAGRWQCPDGTPCAFTPERGWHCAQSDCRLSCCADSPPPADACDHGGSGSPESQRAELAAPTHCEFTVTVLADSTAVAPPAVGRALELPAAPPPLPARTPAPAPARFLHPHDREGQPPGPPLSSAPSRGPPADLPVSSF